MAPPAPKPPAPGGGGGLVGRFTRKVGPLPVWAWAAAILGLILLYMRFGGASGPPAAEEVAPPGPVDGADGGGSGTVSGGGSGDAGSSNDLLAQLYGINAGTIDSLTAALLTQRSLDETAPTPTPGTVGGTNMAPSATHPNGPAAAPVASAPPGTTQRQANVLVWDGQRFTTKAGFNAWAKARGFNVQQYLSNRPQAKAIYSTLA